MIERAYTNIRSSKIVKHNGTVYLTGQVAEGETVTEQAEKCLVNIEALLEEAGSDKKHILQTTIWLADISDFAEMNEVWNAWVPMGHAPARACAESRLARDILKVEFVVTAAVKDT